MANESVEERRYHMTNTSVKRYNKLSDTKAAVPPEIKYLTILLGVNLENKKVIPYETPVAFLPGSECHGARS